eukprot:SAG31_NODE_122_length_23797_cov_39.343812_15_plen_60_part_00
MGRAAYDLYRWSKKSFGGYLDDSNLSRGRVGTLNLFLSGSKFVCILTVFSLRGTSAALV